MNPPSRAVAYHGIFRCQTLGDGSARLMRAACTPKTIPDPKTGRLLRISTLQDSARAICPICASAGYGGFVSFEDDLRIAYACPQCGELVWIAGA